VVADFGFDRAGSYLSGPGRGWLAELDLPPVSRAIRLIGLDSPAGASESTGHA
jgi:hypothetical protein